MSVTINASTSSGLVQTADTSGTVEIQSNGSTKLTVASTGAYGQLVSDTAKSATSTAVDFTGIPSWVKRITVMMQGISTSGTSSPQIQIGAGSFLTTGYLSGAALATNANQTAAANSTTGFVIAGVTATNVRHGQMVLTNISGNTWVSATAGGFSDGAAAFMGGGSVTLSGTLDRVRITTVNGTDTFDAGTINILYEG